MKANPGLAIGANNSVSNLTINLWRINNMSEVQIVYLTVSQIYQLESLAEQEVERLQDEIENDNDLFEGEAHSLQEELEELEEAKSSLYQSHYYRHMYRATDFVRKDWKDEEVSND